MIYEHELQELMAQWSNRIKCQEYDTSYCDAVNECIHELDTVLQRQQALEEDPFNNMSDEDMEEYFNSMQADDYLMSEHYF